MEERAWRFSLFGDELEKIAEFDPLTGEKFADLSGVRIYANSHYITPGPTMAQAITQIKKDLKTRMEEFENQGKLLEAQRIDQRTKFDIEMLEATGICQGIENYSRYLTGRAPGEPPPTLIEYLPEDAVMFLDESHVMVPQLRAMYNGDYKRKSTLVDYGFRLPAAVDNRPLKFEEWNAFRPQTVFVSATPGEWELERTDNVYAEQIVRPTGLTDPPIEVRGCEHQVDDLMAECREVISNGGRVLVTTLTKKMAEALTDYLGENGLKVHYMHSDVDTLERIEIIQELRRGDVDVLVGINLLREGLDIPECQLVAILDADKEGFLRSRTSLIQTSGRAARNIESKVIFYADRVTGSMSEAMEEMSRRREKQMEWNAANGITPESVKKNISSILSSVYERGDHVSLGMHDKAQEELLRDLGDKAHDPAAMRRHIEVLKKQMLKHAENLEFEEAAKLRDEIRQLEEMDLGLA
jgi:excinuclease ABC subunit B